MCGINGIIYFNSYNSNESQEFHKSNIKKMNEEIAHRGPDGEGIFINYPVCFGHRRLSIIDLSENASQPMFNEDKSMALIFNGEIYNYRELIPGLKNKGHIFRTQSDSEVILHSYEEYGTDCVNKFNGMWSFAIYDFKKNKFFASRDRFGVKPFYFYRDSNCFIFSSEIKAILKIRKLTEANHGKVFDYLAYGYKTSNGDTFFKDVKELEPSHNIEIDNSGFKITRYYELNSASGITENGESVSEQIKNLLYDSVRLRFRSDVPVSVLLSGGIDSGIITKITDELIESNEINSSEVTAYSAVYPGYRYDESANITEVINSCSHIKSKLLSPDFNNLPDDADKFVYGMGEPVFSTTSFAHYNLMKEINRNNVKVVLNGQGADESWCGYGRYIAGYYLLDLLFTNPGKFLSVMNSISDKLKFTYKFILQQLIKSILSRRYGSYLRSKYSEKVMNCLNKDFISNNYGYFNTPDYNKFSGYNLTGFMKYNIQYQGFNQILHYEDHSAMQNSVEIRSPFIDYRLMNLAFSIPVKYKFENGITKKILRDIYRSKLPDSIVNNHSKIGFMTPFDQWLNKSEGQKFINDILNTDSFTRKSIWDADKVKMIFENKKSYPEFPFWRIINTELWSKVYGITNL